jgi:hypothetical protein
MYPTAVTELVLAEPDRHMRGRLEARARGAKPSVEVIDAPAEALPFSDGRFDLRYRPWFCARLKTRTARRASCAGSYAPGAGWS